MVNLTYIFRCHMFYCKQHDIIERPFLQQCPNLFVPGFVWGAVVHTAENGFHMHISELILKHEVCACLIHVRNKAIELREIAANPLVSHQISKVSHRDRAGSFFTSFPAVLSDRRPSCAAWRAACPPASPPTAADCAWAPGTDTAWAEGSAGRGLLWTGSWVRIPLSGT